MRKAEQRGWTKKSAPCYVERHHIFIKAIFGENGRVVYLTAREHVLAHLLLFKACLNRYGRHDWRTWKVAGAATAMGIIWERHWGRTSVSCSSLGLARKVDAENKSIRYRGTKLPPRPGYKWYNNGVEQTRAKEHPEGDWVEGRIFYRANVSAEVIEKRTAPKRGRKLSEERKAEIRAKTDYDSEKMSARTKNKKWWNDGTRSVRDYESPGEEWREGRLETWWTNGERNKLSKAPPGETWRKGRTLRSTK
jgi:hypothetical protein